MWNFDEYSNNTAIVSEDGSCISYGDLQRQCLPLAQAARGRCLVFCLCRNEKGSLLGYAAFLNHKIVPLLLDAGLERGLLYLLIETYKPDYLWLPIDSIDGRFRALSQVYSAWGYALLKTMHKNAYPLFDGLALLLTTSGSTGSPKLVRQSYANIQANTESIAEYLELDETERPITTMPMSYTYGLSIINSHLYAGASIILTNKTLMQKEFWHQLKEYKATSFGGVPYIYEMLEKLRFFRMDLPGLRTMTQAGGKLISELHRKFAEYALENGKRFIVMYGQTEATARMSYLPADKSLEKYGSMGIAIPGGEFSLIDTDGNVITQPDVVGELIYKGANVTLGYAEHGDDLIKGDERGGVLITGDMAKRDCDGYYYIVGRKKRFLKIFGNRVNLDDTERLIRAEFDGIDCACAGSDDNLIVYICADEGELDNSISSFLTSKTGLNKSAFTIKAINELPRSESGKILYNQLESFK